MLFKRRRTRVFYFSKKIDKMSIFLLRHVPSLYSWLLERKTPNSFLKFQPTFILTFLNLKPWKRLVDNLRISLSIASFVRNFSFQQEHYWLPNIANHSLFHSIKRWCVVFLLMPLVKQQWWSWSHSLFIGNRIWQGSFSLKVEAATFWQIESFTDRNIVTSN